MKKKLVEKIQEMLQETPGEPGDPVCRKYPNLCDLLVGVFGGYKSWEDADDSPSYMLEGFSEEQLQAAEIAVKKNRPLFALWGAPSLGIPSKTESRPQDWNRWVALQKEYPALRTVQKIVTFWD